MPVHTCMGNGVGGGVLSSHDPFELPDSLPVVAALLLELMLLMEPLPSSLICMLCIE